MGSFWREKTRPVFLPLFELFGSSLKEVERLKVA
jgi:hypothetical protein